MESKKTLKQYNVIISTPIGDRALITADNMWLAQYINDHYTLDEADRLLSGINEVLKGKTPLGGGATQSLQLGRVEITSTKIYKDVDDYYDNPSINPDFELPTTDFKIIVETWRNYLQK